MAMSKRDRDALLRVVKGRFQLLNTEVMRREGQLRVELRTEVEQENEKLIQKYRARLSKLEDEMKALRIKGQLLSDEARGEGLLLRQYGSSNPVEGNVSQEVQVADVEKIAARRFEDIKAKGSLNGGLRELELRITEELLVFDLETDEAKTFLAQIPSLDDVLPLPAGKKAIGA